MKQRTMSVPFSNGVYSQNPLEEQGTDGNFRDSRPIKKRNPFAQSDLRTSAVTIMFEGQVVDTGSKLPGPGPTLRQLVGSVGAGVGT